MKIDKKKNLMCIMDFNSEFERLSAAVEMPV